MVSQLIQIAQGFARSAEEGLPVDHWGQPVPWVARPVVDFLSQLDLSQLSIFEYGGGASTFYWDRRCAAVVTVESNEEWANRIIQGVGPRSRILYRPDQQAFAEAILESEDRYDIILIDAAPAFRPHCAEPALKRLSARGMIILDDAPFYPHAAESLRKAGLIEVDVTGFSALEASLQTTSLSCRAVSICHAAQLLVLRSHSAVPSSTGIHWAWNRPPLRFWRHRKFRREIQLKET
jgi:hypothetical protein